MAEATIRQLQYFVSVLDHGSVTAAAQASHVSQSALSMALSQLERAFGEPLFVRTKAQRITPTPAALRLAPHARNALESITAAHMAVMEEQHSLRGLLRVGCLTTLSPALLPAMVRDLAEHHPDVTLRLVEGSAVELQELVRRGQLDVGFIYRRMLEHDLDHSDLAPATMHVMLPATHPRARASSISIHEVQDLPLLLLDIPPTADSVLGMLMGWGITQPPRLRSGNIETIREYVALGLGYCLVNTIPGHRHSFEGHEIAYVPLADNIPANAITAVSIAGHRPSQRSEVAIDAVARHLAARNLQHGT